MITQGTWKVFPYQSANMDKPVYDIGIDGGVVICRRVENEADARLIVAAPELLSICKDITSWASKPGFILNGEVFIQIKEAIKKAEGK